MALDDTEKQGLGVAAIGHVALFAVLSLSILNAPSERFKSKPIEVTIANEVGLESAAPETSLEPPAPSVAPEIGKPEELTAAPEPEPLPPPPAITPPKKPDKPIEKAKPAPKPTPKPKPAPAAKPKPQPPAKPASQPKPAAKPAAKPQASEKPKGSRLGNDFLKGISDKASTSKSTAPVAASISPAAVASLQQEVLRQLKPHWQALAPTGADAELLRTELRFKLDENGRLVGSPQVLGTTGRNDSNATQAAVHAERAIAAVKRASPFNLPPKFYDAWKDMKIGFDKRLSQ
jgi:outer membrane biosynthesis protein TonB